MVQTNVLRQFDGPHASAELATRLTGLVLASFEKVEFAVCFGSVARAESTAGSDIDLMVVLAASPSDLEVQKFVHAFIDLQLNYGFRPDRRFPAEVISIAQLIAAISWKGIDLSGRTPIIRRLASDDWTPENEYRQWLSAAAGPNRLLCGAEALYERVRDCALASAALLALLSHDMSKFTLQEIITRLVECGKEGLGFVDTPSTRSYLQSAAPRAIALLERLGAIQRLPCGYKIAATCEPSVISSALAGIIEP